MSCSNCFNGCTEIVSDQCVRYTGIDVPVLGIQTGDSLSYVEQALITFLTSTLDGTGIKPVIDPLIICDLVKDYLPTCGDLTAVDLFNALIKAACDLQAQIVVIEGEIVNLQEQIDVIEAPYTVNCLDGVTSGSGTHDVLQAVITKLCAFILDVETNYVQLADLDILIQAYLDSIAPESNLISNKMVPYTVVPFFPTLAIMANFSGSGVGSGDWDRIFLCNGLNGTPDLRGRVPVGTTSGMGTNPLSPVVAPGGLNPAYTLFSTSGANGVTLDASQMPSHIHTGTSTVTITPSTHSHLTVGTSGAGALSSTAPISPTYTSSLPQAYTLKGSTATTATLGQSSNVTIAASATLDINTAGGDTAHSNVQPGIGSYFIMYIPL
jgi:microcystin-dependent protein